MKNNTITTTTRTSPEDAEFLKSIRRSRLNVSEVLMAAPARLLSANVEEVSFPSRFMTRVKEKKVATLADLLRTPLDTGTNLGVRTLEVATEELKKFFVKKIHQKPLTTLRDMMEDFGNDMLAREARIWEMRMGLRNERATLEAVGQKFGLTRERVRQIEGALIKLFAKKYPAVNIIAANVKDGMTFKDFIAATGELIQHNDPSPLVGILETLDPRFYLVATSGMDLILSTTPKTELDVIVRKSVSIAEDIFRASEVLMSRPDMIHALNKLDMDDSARQLAIAKLDKEGRWIEGMLLSPNDDKTNVAVGILQSSPAPVHLEQLVEDIRTLCDEETSEEALRGALSLVPSVRSFGYGMVGFSRHVGISERQANEIIATCERIVQRGKDGFQWNTKDLLGKLQDKYTNLNIGHHELNVILQDSKKLAYLGRLTWVLRGEHEVERKKYRDIFTAVLDKAGKPLPEETLVERAQKQRGLHLNVHLRNDPDFIEVQDNVWGLTRRDHPFKPAELTQLAKAFDATFHSGKEFNNEYLDAKKLDRHGMRAGEIMKVIEVHSDKN